MKMASLSQENLKCPVCYALFQDPVILSCGHSYCNNCLQRWWRENRNLECPVCRRRSLQSDPPRNLALRNLCEAFSLERAHSALAGSGGLCSLHTEELKLFCLNDQQLVCVDCLHSARHKYHSIRSIDEAARDYKEVLQVLLKPLHEKKELFNDMKGNFDETAKDIELQAKDTERQIKDVFSMLQNILKKEEQTRIAALRVEKQKKIQTMGKKSDAVKKDTEALSDIIRETEEVLRAEDLSFLQNYSTAALLVDYFKLSDPQPIPGALIDTDKHLKNLPFKILEKMKEKVTHTLNPQPSPQASAFSLVNYLPNLRITERWNPQAASSLREDLYRQRAGERRSYCEPQSSVSMMPQSSAREDLSRWRGGERRSYCEPQSSVSMMPQSSVREDLSRRRAGERRSYCEPQIRLPMMPQSSATLTVGRNSSAGSSASINYSNTGTDGARISRVKRCDK